MKKILILPTLITTSIFSASFDCDKASTKVEKLICSNDELSKLDEEMSKAYKEALNETDDKFQVRAYTQTDTYEEALRRTDDKETLKKEQRAWLKERNKCDTVSCVEESYKNRKFDPQVSTRKFVLADPNTFSLDNAPNTDPICKAYIEALNNYPLVEDFFEAPMQPNSPDFTYPKWEQLDIYDNKSIYLTVKNYQWNKNINSGRYFNLKIITEKEAGLSRPEDKNTMRNLTQMYYSRADIDNDGNIDDIIKIDSDRYAWNTNMYATKLIIFDGAVEKSLTSIDNHLSNAKGNNSPFYIYNIFFYKKQTYIKEISYDLDSDSFFHMYIKKFNNHQKLMNLCFIVEQYKGEKDAK